MDNEDEDLEQVLVRMSWSQALIPLAVGVAVAIASIVLVATD